MNIITRIFKTIGLILGGIVIVIPAIPLAYLYTIHLAAINFAKSVME